MIVVVGLNRRSASVADRDMLAQPVFTWGDTFPVCAPQAFELGATRRGDGA